MQVAVVAMSSGVTSRVSIAFLNMVDINLILFYQMFDSVYSLPKALLHLLLEVYYFQLYFLARHCNELILWCVSRKGWHNDVKLCGCRSYQIFFLFLFCCAERQLALTVQNSWSLSTKALLKHWSKGCSSVPTIQRHVSPLSSLSTGTHWHVSRKIQFKRKKSFYFVFPNEVN